MYLWCLYKSTVICDGADTAGSWHNRRAVVLIGMKLVELEGGGRWYPIHPKYTYGTTSNDPDSAMVELSGLENITGPLVFTSASGCRASENFDSSREN